MQEDESQPKTFKVYLDEDLNVSTSSLARAQARGLPSDFLTYLREREVSLALDCSRAANMETLRVIQGRKAEIKELLGLFTTSE